MSWQRRLSAGMNVSLAALMVALILVSSEWNIQEKPSERAHWYTRAVEFDFFDWSVQAIAIKVTQATLDTPFHLTESGKRQLVTDALQGLDAIAQAEQELSLIYADPAIANPVEVSLEVRAELDALQEHQRRLAPLAEAVLESQVADILAEVGLTTAGQPLPPVLFHISPLPYHLVLSRRDLIEQETSISVLPDMTIDRQAELEERVAAGTGLSALVVPVGGIGTYPAMVMRSSHLAWLTDTVAHEWIHNWLSFRPLGASYGDTPELRTMNETAASIAGSEIAELVLARYYLQVGAPLAPLPEVLPINDLLTAPMPPGSWPRPVFDSRAEMHATRLRADELLAAGQIEEAEAYMEARRQVFWEHGILIRKLNQAYFAFYGAYADMPGGAAGEDPVGPAVRQLRAQSESLADFLHTIAAMSSFADLEAEVSR